MSSGLIVASLATAGRVASASDASADGPDRIAPSGSRCFDVSGDPGDLAVINLTPVRATGPGYGSLSSAKGDATEVSNVNYAAGTIDPNIAVATIGADQQVCFHNSAQATVDLVADQLATITADAATAITPRRVIDTRTSSPVTPSGSRCFDVSGDPGDLAVINLTPVRATGPGYGSLSSSDDPPNGISNIDYSNVNYAAGTIDPNIAVATIGADQQVCFHNSAQATVDLVADQLATITADAATAITPRRVIDTRTGTGLPVEPYRSRCFDVSGDPGDLAVINLTPVRPTGPGHGSLSSSEGDATGVSNVNYVVGTIDPNIAVATIGADQQVCFHNSAQATVDLVADQLATITADAATAITPRRVIDTRTSSPVTFDVASVFGDVGADALAVTGGGRVVAAVDSRILVRNPEGDVETIDLPDDIVVSQAWVGTDDIAVVWGADRGAEVDLRSGRLVTRLTRIDDTWTRTDPSSAGSYTTSDRARPSNPLGLDLVIGADTILPTIEGAGGFWVFSDPTEQWTVGRPPDGSAFVDEISPSADGGYVVTMRAPASDPAYLSGVFLFVLHPGGTIESFGYVDGSEEPADTQPSPDGLTVLRVATDVATLERIPIT